MSPTDACQAGAVNAEPHPIRNVNVSSSHGVIAPNQVQSASTADTTSRNVCARIIRRRRSKLSAMAPATRASSTIGSAVEACTSATMSAERAIEVIIHAAPTDWIMPPKLETVLAIHTERKTGDCIGASADARGAAPAGGELEDKAGPRGHKRAGTRRIARYVDGRGASRYSSPDQFRTSSSWRGAESTRLRGTRKCWPSAATS